MTDPMTTDSSHRPKFDGTINIPTLLSVAIAVVSVTAWSSRNFATLDKGAAAMQRDIDRVEKDNAELRRDQVQKIDALRSEMRGEFRDHGQKLDTLLMRKESR